MKTTDAFKQTILSYLQQRAATDNLFYATFNNPDKNIDDCCTYILNTVKKSGCAGFTDDEVFSMAVHYYDENNIKIGPVDRSVSVVVNHVVDISEEEKKAAKDAALQKIQEEFYNKLHQKKTSEVRTVTKVEQLSLFGDEA